MNHNPTHRHSRLLVSIIALPFSLTSLSSMAGDIYIGAKAGWGYDHNECESPRLIRDNNALGAGFYTGHEINSWLAVEAGYDYFSDMKTACPTLRHSDVGAPYVSKVQGIELGPKPYFDVMNEQAQIFARLGTFAWWADVTSHAVGYQYASEHGWSPMLGAGFEIAMTNNLSARMEYQWFHNVGDCGTGSCNINLLSAGVTYRFGVNPAVPAAAITVAIP